MGRELEDCMPPKDSDVTRGVMQWTTTLSVWWRHTKLHALRLPFFVGHCFKVGDPAWSMADWYSEDEQCYHIGSAGDPRIPWGKCPKRQASAVCSAFAPLAADYKLPPAFSRMWLLGEVPELQPTRTPAGHVHSSRGRSPPVEVRPSL